VQLPGRAYRIAEPPFRALPQLVNELASALLPLFDRPFVFFGHSMGALLSFELARWLRRKQFAMPQHLMVSGRRAPQIPNTDHPMYLMCDKDLLSYIEQLKGTPKQVLQDPELVRLILPVLRADSELCETYTYEEESPLACPISAFCGRGDEDETCERLKAWRIQTTNSFSLHLLNGNHFFIHSEEQELLRILHQELFGVRSSHL
jgi:medium-chain acyl-[acyl-carrier-protein] hydrolase